MRKHGPYRLPKHSQFDPGLLSRIFCFSANWALEVMIVTAVGVVMVIKGKKDILA